MTVIGEALSRARLPVLVTDYAGATKTGFEALLRVADRLASPVVDCGRRLNFPTTHSLAFGEDILGDADAILALDVEDPAGVLSGIRTDTRVFNVTPAHLKLRSWAQDYQQLRPAELHVTATCDTALPALLAACSVDDGVRTERTTRLAERAAAAREESRGAAARARSERAIAVEALAIVLGEELEGETWTLVHGSLSGWERRLWPFERFGQHLGWHGGGGLGYGPGASIGAAVALGGDALALNVQPDGDLLYAPAALWVAARYRVPLLTVMHNNRQYQNTVEHARVIGEARRASSEGRHLGAALDDPPVDFARLAHSFGVWAAGPVTDVEALHGELARALDAVRSGAPALASASRSADSALARGRRAGLDPLGSPYADQTRNRRRQIAHRPVAHGAGERVLQLGNPVVPSRSPQDVVRNRHSTTLVLAERCSWLGIRVKHVPERDTVLDCLCASLPEVGRHRVCGISQQRHPADDPVRQWIAVHEIRLEDVLDVGCLEHRLDRFVPAVVAFEEHLFPLGSGHERPQRRVPGGEPVRPAPSEILQADPAATTPALDDVILTSGWVICATPRNDVEPR